MERLKLEEIANNYGMHLENFAQRKVLADQINFALDFGMEYYQVGFHYRLFRGQRTTVCSSLDNNL